MPGTGAASTPSAGRPSPSPSPSPASPPLPDEEVSASPYRGDQLEAQLGAMCRRAGFAGAVVADASGLPLAAVNSPVAAERVAAFTSVLGESLRQADHLLGEQAANNLSLDINYTDKLVLRQFLVDGAAFYLAVICPQDVDERGEIELTLDQVAALLSAH